MVKFISSIQIKVVFLHPISGVKSRGVMLVLVIGNVRNFQIIVQDGVMVHVYSVDRKHIFIIRYFSQPPIKDAVYGTTLLLWFVSVSVLAEKKRSCARHGAVFVLWPSM